MKTDTDYNLIISVLRDIGVVLTGPKFNFSVDKAPMMGYYDILGGGAKVVLLDCDSTYDYPYREMSIWEHKHLAELLNELALESSFDHLIKLCDDIHDWTQSLWGIMEWNEVRC